MKINFALSAFLGIALFASCEKKDDPAAANRTELISEKQWILTAVTVDPALPLNGTLVTNWYAQMDECDKDDIAIFRKNGVYEFNEGASKCDPNAPQTAQTTWSFNSTETVVTVGSSSFTLVELTKDKIIDTRVHTINGINYTFTETWGIKPS
ncbi:hypothetical protein SAMN05421823_101637 [Catalinimonas alkaloidigena]|uniref:Lipocalin-like domain-containing protein n=1 Tax=Catalinimonas alkaloidigena TaxID=1075417 RepID=A0A1G8YCV6_9BACT|nr:hypothetical protein [Catalinimonas alkaloidigena]SDK00688.1 hypothetical protein SAMN05421823_101637 [Catalinimonas alkaloidigena]